jgi:uncharacterized protein
MNETEKPSPIQPTPEPVSPVAVTPEQERTWAMLAHLSMLINLVTGVLGPVAAFVIYITYRDRSRYIAFQSLQSLILQLITWVAAGIIIGLMWAITGMLSAVIVGVLCIPFAIILSIILAALPIAGVAYSIIGAIQCSEGRDFRYWLIGEWIITSLMQPDP